MISSLWPASFDLKRFLLTRTFRDMRSFALKLRILKGIASSINLSITTVLKSPPW